MAFHSCGSQTTELITGALALHRAPHRGPAVTHSCTLRLGLPCVHTTRPQDLAERLFL